MRSSTGRPGSAPAVADGLAMTLLTLALAGATAIIVALVTGILEYATGASLPGAVLAGGGAAAGWLGLAFGLLSTLRS